MFRFFLCDPSLIGFSGHCLGYLEAVRRALPVEWKSFLLGNKNVDETVRQMYGVFPIFTHWIDHIEHKNPLRNAEYHSKIILKDLNGSNDIFHFGSNDWILINSLRQWGLLGVLRWMESLGVEKTPMVVLILHFSALEEEAWRYLYCEFFNILSVSPIKEKMRLFTDSDSLTQEFQEYGCKDIVTAPIPHVPDLPVHISEEPLVVSYMGAARSDKGFQYLPYLLKRTKYTPGLPDVRFEIMAWVSNPQEDFFSWNIEYLCEDKRVKLYMDPLNENEYYGILKKTDIGLILYNNKVYAKQTSGILAELVAAGVVIVASRGTWAAQQVDQYELGTLSMPDDPISAGDALVKVIKNFSKWKEKQNNGRKLFLGFHNSVNFSKIILKGL
ncbi:MAG: glycosyltransferase [Streptococcaceae bacterium]|jgi:glycosyltransferase involved in cell wall biosynthesis|nr:glycosyltransferase [Streptococcaceae bacterium]